MKRPLNSEKKSISFSYMDPALILLACLLISLGIGLLFEARSRNEEKNYTVVLEDVVPAVLEESVPKEKDRLYADGAPCGEVVSVRLREISGGFSLTVTCRLDFSPKGENMTLETANFIRSMKIVSVEGM